MIEYTLIDINNNEFELSGATIEQPAKSSLTYLEDSFDFNLEIREKSFLDGAVKLGEKRLKSKSIAVNFIRSFNNYTDYITAQNLLLYNLRKAIYLRDKTNNRQTDIEVESFRATYDEGGHKLLSNNTIKFKVLTPYWTSIIQSSKVQSLTNGINEVDLVNQGSLSVFPIITFTTTHIVNSIEMYFSDTKYGMIITDALFGLTGYLTMIIDNKEGTIKINSLDRTASIVSGTGYFSIPVGSSILNVNPSASCDINMTWYKKDYI